MFPKTRQRVNQAIDGATSDVHDLTAEAQRVGDTLIVFAAALVLVSVFTLLLSAYAVERSNR